MRHSKGIYDDPKSKGAVKKGNMHLSRPFSQCNETARRREKSSNRRQAVRLHSESKVSKHCVDLTVGQSIRKCWKSTFAILTPRFFCWWKCFSRAPSLGGKSGF